LDDAQATVQAAASVVGFRLHKVTVLSILDAVQLVWLAALGYGLIH
jgi:hypothetical protein